MCRSDTDGDEHKQYTCIIIINFFVVFIVSISIFTNTNTTTNTIK